MVSSVGNTLNFAFGQGISVLNGEFCKSARLYRHPTCELHPQGAIEVFETTAKRAVNWKCMLMCGACCKLGDFDLEVLEKMLGNEDDVAEYLSMVGEDGWCIHFDSAKRSCKKYERRPRFCRVTPKVFHDLYGVDSDELGEFATDCCEYHIGNVYGDNSQEMDRFNRQRREINKTS